MPSSSAAAGDAVVQCDSPADRLMTTLLMVARCHYTRNELYGTDVELLNVPYLYQQAQRSRLQVTNAPRILLVLEDKIVAYTIKMLLERLGVYVTLVFDIVSAFRAFRRHAKELSLVLCEWGLHPLGGQDLVRFMRNEGSMVCFAAVVGRGVMAGDAVRGGSDLFFRKPLLLHLQALRSLLLPRSMALPGFPVVLLRLQTNHEAVTNLFRGGDEAAGEAAVTTEQLIREVEDELEGSGRTLGETAQDASDEQFVKDMVQFLQQQQPKYSNVRLHRLLTATMQSMQTARKALLRANAEVAQLRSQAHHCLVNHTVTGLETAAIQPPCLQWLLPPGAVQASIVAASSAPQRGGAPSNSSKGGLPEEEELEKALERCRGIQNAPPTFRDVGTLTRRQLLLECLILKKESERLLQEVQLRDQEKRDLNETDALLSEALRTFHEDVAVKKPRLSSTDLSSAAEVGEPVTATGGGGESAEQLSVPPPLPQGSSTPHPPQGLPPHTPPPAAPAADGGIAPPPSHEPAKQQQEGETEESRGAKAGGGVSPIPLQINWPPLPPPQLLLPPPPAASSQKGGGAAGGIPPIPWSRIALSQGAYVAVRTIVSGMMSAMNHTAQQILARHPDTHPLIAELESNLDLVCPSTNPVEAIASTLPDTERANAFLPIPPAVVVRTTKERTALTRRVDNEKCFQQQVKLLATMSSQRLVARFYYFWAGVARGSAHSAARAVTAQDDEGDSAAAAAGGGIPHPPPSVSGAAPRHAGKPKTTKKSSAPSSAASRTADPPTPASPTTSRDTNVEPSTPTTAAVPSKPASATSSSSAAAPATPKPPSKVGGGAGKSSAPRNNSMNMPQMAKLTT